MARRGATQKKAEKIPEEDPFINDDEEEEDEDADLEADGPPVIDPYAVLSLDKDASADDVKKAYRKMALKHHPGMGFAKIELDVTNFLQIRHLRTRRKPPTKPFKRLHSHTLFSQMSDAASATTLLEALPKRSKTTMSSTGSSSTANNSRISSIKRTST